MSIQWVARQMTARATDRSRPHMASVATHNTSDTAAAKLNRHRLNIDASPAAYYPPARSAASAGYAAVCTPRHPRDRQQHAKATTQVSLRTRAGGAPLGTPEA